MLIIRALDFYEIEKERQTDRDRENNWFCAI